MVPPPPPLFSTSTGWPSVSLIRLPTRRATMSVVPPGGNGTSTRTGLDGKGCAFAFHERKIPRKTQSSLRIAFSSVAGLDARALDQIGVVGEFLRQHLVEVVDRQVERVDAELG